MYAIRFWTAIAFIFGILPLGLSSTEMWDGVVAIHAMTTNDWTAMQGWVLDSNWYLTYVIFSVIDSLQHALGLPLWISFKLLTVVAIIGIAAEVYLLAKRVFGIPNAVAAWLPAVVFSFPIWYVFFSYTCMIGHLTCVWLGLAGYRLIYSNKTWAAALGAVVITLSFQLASNCAFILALELGRWFVCKEKALWSYRRSGLLLLLSIVVFATTRIIWPPVGTYVGYNRFLNPLQLNSWISYSKYSALFATWLVLLVPMFLGLWWASKRNGISASMATGGIRSMLKHQRIVLGVFAFLMLSACGPYIAVGLGSPLFTVNVATSGSVSAVLASSSALGPVGVWFGGWGARHMLLMMIPMILFAGWVASLADQKTLSDGDMSRTKRVSIRSSFIVTIIVCLALGVSGHWAKLQRLAKEQTLVRLLADKPQIPHGQVDLLLDKHEDFLSSIYETNYLLYRAYKSTHWAALMLPDNPVVRAWGDEHRRLTLDVPPKDRTKIAGLNVMASYSWSDSCKTTARINFPSLSAWDVLWRTEHAPTQLPKARIQPISSTCNNANTFWQAK